MPYAFQRICTVIMEVSLTNLDKVGVRGAGRRTKPWVCQESSHHRHGYFSSQDTRSQKDQVSRGNGQEQSEIDKNHSGARYLNPPL